MAWPLVLLLTFATLGSVGSAQERAQDLERERQSLRRWFWYFEPLPAEMRAAEFVERRRTTSDPELLFYLSELVGPRGVPTLKDDTLEREFLEAAAGAGYMPAAATLGLKLVNGYPPFARDPGKGKALIDKSVAADEGLGYLHLGMAHYSGTDVFPKDVAAAERAFREALVRGILRAHFFLALTAAGRGEPSLAERHLQIGARAGDPQAMHGLALYLWKHETQAEREEGLQWAARASNEGFPDFQYTYALMLYERDSTKVDPRVDPLLDEAARAGSANAAYLRAVLHLTNKVECPDPQLARRLLRYAADAGHEEAKRALARIETQEREHNE